jgi:desulfoferrodoxin (superoxide reductase-like protein)
MDKLLLSATVFDGSMNSKHHILWISLLPHRALPRNKVGSQGHCYASTEEIQQNGTADLTAIPKNYFQKCFQQW